MPCFISKDFPAFTILCLRIGVDENQPVDMDI